MTQVWYCSRSDAKAAQAQPFTSALNYQVDRAVAAASDEIGANIRRFEPSYETRVMDWPSYSDNPSGGHVAHLWIEGGDLVSVVSVSVDGVVLAGSDYRVGPYFGAPPYMWLELPNRSGSGYRSVSVTGWWGYTNNTVPGGALAASLTDSATTVTVTNSRLVDVGHLLYVDGEYMICSDAVAVATSTTATSTLAADMSVQTLTVSDGALLNVGEVLALNAERMTVESITGNTVTVRRAVDGSTLAAHTNYPTIYAPRLLTVERGAQGTTAAAHSNGAAVRVWSPPASVRSLAVGLAGAIVSNEQRAGDPKAKAADMGVGDLWKRVDASFRHRRIGVV